MHSAEPVHGSALGSVDKPKTFEKLLMMDFEWDETKALTNQRKHGVSFFEATEVFSDALSSCVHDPDHSYEEERYLLFGYPQKGITL